MSIPGTMPPAVKLKLALLLPYITFLETVPTDDTNDTLE